MTLNHFNQKNTPTVLRKLGPRHKRQLAAKARLMISSSWQLSSPEAAKHSAGCAVLQQLANLAGGN